MGDMAEKTDALNRYAGAENAEGSVLREEEQFLRDYDPSAFEHPSVTVDILLFTVEERQLKVLLVRRATPPFKGRWAIPGGFLRMEESAEEAAARRIREEAITEDTTDIDDGTVSTDPEDNSAATRAAFDLEVQLARAALL